MRRRMLAGLLLSFGLLSSSCYPQLSVQQYDQLRKDIAALDVQRQSLEQQLASAREKNRETLAYVKFLGELKATQSSEKLMSGQFDAASLISNKDRLLELTRSLGKQGDNDVAYYLELMKPGEDAQTMQAYYKIFEICVKKIKANLE